jgi:uncharacterized protein with HEPN domain
MLRDDATLLDIMIAGMRDKLIHSYDAVDLDEVWKTANIDIPHPITLLKPLEPDAE